MVVEGRRSVGAARELHARRARRTKINLGLFGDLARFAQDEIGHSGLRPGIDDAADRSQRRHEVGFVLERERNSFGIDQVAVLDRVDSGPQRVLDPAGSDGVGRAAHAVGVRLADAGTQLFLG